MEFRAKKTAGQKCNIILDTVVTIIKYIKITIDHDIYIKVLSDGTVSYLKVYTNGVLNTSTNDIAYPEPRTVFEEVFYNKVQEGYVLKYLNFRIFSLLFVSVLIRLITSRN